MPNLYYSRMLEDKVAGHAINSNRLDREICYLKNEKGETTAREIKGQVVRPRYALAIAASNPDANGKASFIFHNLVSENGLTDDQKRKFPDVVQVASVDEYKVVRDSMGREMNTEFHADWGLPVPKPAI